MWLDSREEEAANPLPSNGSKLMDRPDGRAKQQGVRPASKGKGNNRYVGLKNIIDSNMLMCLDCTSICTLFVYTNNDSEIENSAIEKTTVYFIIFKQDSNPRKDAIVWLTTIPRKMRRFKPEISGLSEKCPSPKSPPNFYRSSKPERSTVCSKS